MLAKLFYSPRFVFHSSFSVHARRAAMAAVCATALLCGARSAMAAGAGDQLFSSQQAERHGLTRAWYVQVPVVGGLSRITHVVQNDGLLLVQTSAAILYAYDTETGRLVWSAEVGDARLPTQAPGANGKPGPEKPGASSVDKLITHETDTSDKSLLVREDKVVAVVNGSVVYLLNRADGSVFVDPKNAVEWKVQLRKSPSAGPLVTDNWVIVPTVSGLLECYPTYDSKVSPTYMLSSGVDETQPTEVGDRITWVSARGMIQITQPRSLVVRHYVETTGPMVAPATSYAPLVFAGSIDGYLYAVNSTTGDVVWKQTVGSAIRQPPVAIRTAVFAVVEDGGLYRAAMADGHHVWTNPAPRHFLAASRTHIYTTDEYGHMLVLNSKTGATIDSMPLPAGAVPFSNEQTDRIFLTNDNGIIQCLHEAQLEQPENYLAPKPEKPVEEQPKGKKPAPAEEPKEKADDAKKADVADAKKADADADPLAPKAAMPEKK